MLFRSTIEAAYAHIDEVKPPRAQKNLREHYDMAEMSKALATIEVDAPIVYELEQAKLGNLFTPEAYEWMKKLEFKHMQGRFPRESLEAPVQQHFRKITRRTEAEDVFARAGKAACVGFQFLLDPESSHLLAQGAKSAGSAEPEGTKTPSGMRLEGEQSPSREGLEKGQSPSGMGMEGEQSLSCVALGAGKNPCNVELEGEQSPVRVAMEAGQSPGSMALQRKPGAGLGMEADGQLTLESILLAQAGGAPGQEEEEVQEGVSHILGLALAFGKEDIYFLEAGGELSGAYLAGSMAAVQKKSKRLGTFGLKSQLPCFFVPRELRFQVTDILIGAYLLNPLKNDYDYDTIAKEHLGLLFPSRQDLLGKLPLRQAAREKEAEFLQYACFMAYTSFLASQALEGKLKDSGMWALFCSIEMPLVYTLYDMEQEGVLVNAEELKSYGESLTGRIGELEQEIYQDAGEEFNINSPKQLGAILFEKLKMPYGKKTKTGYSTAADVLDKLAPEYPLVSKILEYRQLAKLKSTYADGLANFIQEDGRIHSTFHQTITATGRLSSTDPNLQNIPIRMELGRQIRKVFIPKEGCVLIDADYSQIELRVLAHMSGDENLIKAYREAQDIHRMTASQVFHVPLEEVTSLQRRNAKAVNFGIVYGISSFGLSQDLSISKKEAAEYIEAYFQAYPGIKTFLDRLVSEAREQGYVSTMFGRRRPVPELASSNFMQRSFGERVAMNAPIQGTAADIIKIAMIRVNDALKGQGLRSRLILQVHDELLVEAYEEEAGLVEAILKKEMEHAADLSVELDIGMDKGKNWYEAH